MKRWRTEAEIRSGLLQLWDVMQACVERAAAALTAFSPAGCKVKRRAAELCLRLKTAQNTVSTDPLALWTG